MQRVILVGELVNDIRAGLNDSELMKKYNLALEGLQDALRQLLALEAMRPEEIYGRLPAFGDEVILATSEAVLKNLRECPRHPVELPVTVYDARSPEARGSLRDVNLTGVGIKGIEARVTETRTLVVAPLDDLPFDPFILEAECRWTGREREGDYLAGFRILKISKENQRQLEELIKLADSNSRHQTR